MRETPLLLVSAACGFSVSSSHPIQLFLWDPAPAQRCLPFSRVLQSRRHTLPAPLCSPRQPQNTRPGHSPVPAQVLTSSCGEGAVLPSPAGAQSNALPKISSSTRTFHIFSGSLFPLAGRAASFWEDSQALAWRSAKGGTGRRGAKVPGQEGSPSFLRPPGSQRSKLCSWELRERSGHLSEPGGGSARGKVVSVGPLGPPSRSVWPRERDDLRPGLKLQGGRCGLCQGGGGTPPPPPPHPPTPEPWQPRRLLCSPTGRKGGTCNKQFILKNLFQLYLFCFLSARRKPSFFLFFFFLL